MQHPSGADNRLIVVPYWFPAAAFDLVPLSWVIRTRRQLGLLGVMILAWKGFEIVRHLSIRNRCRIELTSLPIHFIFDSRTARL
jgi:hypothetical protein